MKFKTVFWLSMICLAGWLTYRHYRKPDLSVSVAQNVIDGVGAVRSTSEEGRYGPVFVFEEQHNSPRGQAQIATMLLRLHDRYGVNKIGLEGFVQRDTPLDASWYHDAGAKNGKTPSVSVDKQDVALARLESGAVSASELMAMLYSDVKVYGLERQDEYDVRSADGAEIKYLLDIAVTQATPDVLARAKTMSRSEHPSDALEYLIKSNDWAKAEFERLTKDQVRSVEEDLNTAIEIQSKAKDLNIEIPEEDAREFDQQLIFYRAAMQRSSTMVSRITDLPGTGSREARIMVIGAGHTSKVTDLLRQAHFQYTVIRPLSLETEDPHSLTLTAFDRLASGLWPDSGPLNLGGILAPDQQRHKPAPMLERRSAESYASMNLAAHLAANAVRANQPVPSPELLSELRALPGLRVDENSFAQMGKDVIFSAQVQDNQGDWKTVWVRAGSTGDLKSAKTLEQKLLELSTGGDGGGKGGGKPPHATDAEDSDGSGGNGRNEGKGLVGEDDRKDFQKSLGVSHAGLDTVAIFSEEREKVVSHAALSD